MFWCLILNSFSIFVSERCQTKKFAVVGNGSDGCMWRRNPFWRRRRCARVRKDGFVKRILGTALWPRLLLKALVGFCFPGQVGAPMCGGPLFEILAVGGVEFADPRGSRFGSLHFGGSLAESLYNVYFWRKPYFFHAGLFFGPVSRKLYWFFAATPDSTVPWRRLVLTVLDSAVFTFLTNWSRSGCYVGVGLGSVNVLDKWITQWMLGWGGAVLTFRARWSRSVKLLAAPFQRVM